MEQEAENLYDGLRNLGDTITDSVSNGTVGLGGRFPFVIVDKFETHGEHARDRSKLESIIYAPLVPSALVPAWESFSFEHQDWIEKSRAKYLEKLPLDASSPVYLNGNISPYVYHRRDGIFPVPSPRIIGDNVTAPIWYLSPPPFNPGIVNFDMMQRPEYESLVTHAITTAMPAFSPVLDVEKFLSLQVADADHYLFHKNVAVTEEAGLGYDHPHSLYVQPVYTNSSSNEVVGILMGVVAWDSYFSDILPDVQGIYAVLRSGCSHSKDQSFTWIMNAGVVSIAIRSAYFGRCFA